MVGGVLFLLLLCAIGVAVAMWVRANVPGHEPVGEAERSLKLTVRQPRRISLLTEAIAYIGTILVLAGAASALGQQWSNFSNAARLVVLLVVTLLFLVLGWLTRSSTEPAFRRMSAVSWAVSVAALAGTAAVVNTIYDWSAPTAFLVIAIAATLYATGLWWISRHAIQHLVLYLGVLLSAAAILVRAIHEPAAGVVAGTLWAIAVGWTALGWSRRISPWWAAVPLGLFVALVAPAFIGTEWVRFSLGIATAAAVMGISVFAKFAPGLGFGTVGMLAYVVAAVMYYFRKSLGVPTALALTGGLILITAVVVARLLPSIKQKSAPQAVAPPGQPPSAKPHGRRAA